MSEYMKNLSAELAHNLDEHFPVAFNADRLARQGLAIAEESGEFVGALSRYLGHSRRTGTLDEVAAELADLEITLHLTAHYLGIDVLAAVENKAEVIFSRGFKDPR